MKWWEESRNHNTKRNTEPRQIRGVWSMIISLKWTWRKRASNFQGNNLFGCSAEAGTWVSSLTQSSCFSICFSLVRQLAIFLSRKNRLRSGKKGLMLRKWRQKWNTCKSVICSAANSTQYWFFPPMKETTAHGIREFHPKYTGLGWGVTRGVTRSRVALRVMNGEQIWTEIFIYI